MLKPSQLNRRKFISSVGAAAIVSIAGCSGEANGDNEMAVNLAGGATSSAGYNMGTAYSQLLREKEEELNITSQSTGGTTANVRLIPSNDYDFGTTTSTDLINGANAEGDYEEEYSLYQLFSFNSLPLPVCCTLTDHDDINYIEDLPGVEMAGSPPGTPDAPTLISYLDANGLWDGEGTIEFSRDARDQGLRQLGQGNVQAAAGYAVNHSPPPWMNEWLNRRDDAKLLFPESEENVQNFVDAHPGGIQWELQLENFGVGWENSAYSDQETVLTPGIAQQYATTSEMSDEVAYAITERTFNYRDELPEYHDLWSGFSTSGLDLASIFNDEAAPYHPGAAEALREQGAENLIVADE